MILKAPFRLPPGFLPAFRYRGGQVFVALFWSLGGEEVVLRRWPELCVAVGTTGCIGVHPPA